MRRKFSHNGVAGLAGFLSLFSTPALSDATDTLSDYIGYTVAAKKTIVGFVNDDGEKEDGFQGCNHGRVIIFSDNTYLECDDYGYQYAYRPDAVLLVRSGRIVMIVEDDAYDMRR